ncbi:MAG: hypothetical protein AW07_00215 [Candidatus Accumulibacter sp. SK-11]|nr:MAG: hypothetical protein AW07_00215 [Candidatus Accumulibacter sp. SK-11]
MHSGREFSAQEVADVCATVAWLPGLARHELAATLCEHLGWVTLTGTAKIDACLEFLKRLQAAGLLVLPTPRPSPRRRSTPPRAVSSGRWSRNPPWTARCRRWPRSAWK